jgi:mono/diheme cytochrome c family protein
MHRLVATILGTALVFSGCHEPEPDNSLRPQPLRTSQAAIGKSPQQAELAPAPSPASGPSPASDPSAQGTAEPAPKSVLPGGKGAPPTPEQMAAGQSVYTATCLACHQATGTGVPGLFPPLAESDYLMADKERSIRVVLQGLTGPITVNGQAYNMVMPPLANLSDKDVAAVLSYVRNTWGNSGDAVTPEEVAKVRASPGAF